MELEFAFGGGAVPTATDKICGAALFRLAIGVTQNTRLPEQQADARAAGKPFPISGVANLVTLQCFGELLQFLRRRARTAQPPPRRAPDAARSPAHRRCCAAVAGSRT
jgi:hypothetical protein